MHATFVRSTVAHALVGGGRRRARRARLPGVVDVVTGAEVDLRPVPGVSNRAMARPVLAVDRVRFVGEPVAVVLTETPEQGADAAEWVVVDYEPLPAVVDPIDGPGRRGGAVPRAGHEPGDRARRRGRRPTFPAGRPGARSWSASASSTSAWPPCPLEGRSAAAAWVDGRLVRVVLDAERPRSAARGGVDVRAGRGRGARSSPPTWAAASAPRSAVTPRTSLLGWLARRCGRPVRWAETRTENMIAMVHGRAQIHDVTIGGRRDGTIEAYHLDIVQDAGAYPSMGAFLPRLTRIDGGRHVRHPGRHVARPGGAHHDRPRWRVPRGRAARGHRRHRAGGRPVRRRGGPGPGRGAPAEPACPRSPRRTRRPRARPTTAATTPRRSSGRWRPPATTTCGPSRPAGAPPATTGCWASGCRATSRSRAGCEPAASSGGSRSAWRTTTVTWATGRRSRWS